MGPRIIHFAHRIERWDADDRVAEDVAGVEDFLLAMATYEAACRRWPGARVTLSQGHRVIEDSRPTSTPSE
jgi:hypothetical protein